VPHLDGIDPGHDCSWAAFGDVIAILASLARQDDLGAVAARCRKIARRTCLALASSKVGVDRSLAGDPSHSCAVIFTPIGIFLRRWCASADTVAIMLQASTTA
jgi:hypothetical protein